MKVSDLFQGIGNPISLYPDLVPIVGSHNAAIFLCQLCYWTGKQRNPKGWIYKTQEDWQLETELSPKEQKAARRLLTEKGFIEERFTGIPRRLEYRVLLDELDNNWDTWIPAMRIKFWLRQKLDQEATLLSRGLADEALSETIKVLRDGLAQARRFPKEAETIEKTIIDQMEIIEKGTQKPYSPDGLFKPLSPVETRGDQEESHDKTSKTSLLYTEITSKINSETTSKINPPLPPKGKKEGESVKVVEVEVTNKELATIPSFVASTSQASTQEDNFSCRADRPTKKRDNTVTILDRYESGEVAHLPRHELIKIANQQIGEVVRAYRRSGRILASSPNDINRAFLAFIAKRDRKDTEYATRLINVCERTPDRWGELTEMVKSWKAKEVFNGYSAEHVAEVHSILQNIADL
jgi:hypothetical protein